MARTTISTDPVGNILLETGDNTLLEDSSFLLLEDAVAGGRFVVSSRTVIGTTRDVISSRSSI